MTKHVQWDGNLNQEGFEILKGEGGCIVCPTKVGYIIMTSDKAGLERKFEAKERNRNKPGVVLCGSMDELRSLAQLTPEIDAFYQKHWDEDILLGCILPWREDAYAKLQAFGDGREELMTDVRGTSCFVIKFGKAGEQIAKEMWEKEGKMVYASSANPSGKGNRGKVEGIGERIENAIARFKVAGSSVRGEAEAVKRLVARVRDAYAQPEAVLPIELAAIVRAIGE